MSVEDVMNKKNLLIGITALILLLIYGSLTEGQQKSYSVSFSGGGGYLPMSDFRDFYSQYSDIDHDHDKFGKQIRIKRVTFTNGYRLGGTILSCCTKTG